MTTTDEPRYELAQDLASHKTPLTPDDMPIVGRLAGRVMTQAELVRELNAPAAQVQTQLERLVARGAVVVSGRSATSTASPSSPWHGFVFAPADLAAGPEIPLEQKKRILYVDAHLSSWTHYQLLDVARSSSADEIKNAYFKFSKEFHPDAFFRKDLGPHRARVDRIFRAAKAAYDVLRDVDKRRAYDATIVAAPSARDRAYDKQRAEEAARDDEQKARLARLADAQRESRLKRNPVVERMQRARDYVAMAEQALQGGRFDEAANHARLALTFDDGLKGKVEGILASIDRARVELVVKRLAAATKRNTGEFTDEIRSLIEQNAAAVEKVADPTMLLEFATSARAMKLNKRAFRAAQLAAEREGSRVEAWTLVAEIAAEEGLLALCARAAERWAALDPQARRPRELLKLARGR